jgi:hypothetical protein
MVKRRAADKRATELMNLGFDIFRQLDDGSPIWVANVQTRAQAERELASLLRSAPARYFVRDAETGKVISDTGLGTAGETGPAG